MVLIFDSCASKIEKYLLAIMHFIVWLKYLLAIMHFIVWWNLSLCHWQCQSGFDAKGSRQSLNKYVYSAVV